MPAETAVRSVEVVEVLPFLQALGEQA